MAKQLNINLGFNANTQSASAAIQKLSLELQSLGKNTQMTNLPITNQIVEAQMAAKELGNILQSSLNVETGQFDLSKFNTQLQSSGKNLAYYGNQLGALGPKGDQAFLKIAQSIVKTEVPLRRSNGLLMQFATTLKNTARWQISSSILHGFMGAISSAYGYAKKLDESLNNIRIVTGASAEEMTAFAAQANKAAQALSTTTTAYTDASLIFYQQGYRDQEEIAERAETVIKMANVTQQSAQVVSDQMTAIWNNFDDGSKSLEYYADVMARLGAETASSTAEIAGGIEKFAGVAETIGLSYEYAAASLATITAETRMSEEVVGTALKTIFARIQGLKLGETLEDGTSLNKYSEALKAVGISIYDTSGELKNMDNILDEMGAKWQTISKDQQVALAQTVAGVRQYTQLVTLMDNWDTMEDNLDLAYGAEGTLDEQHKLYEEGWKASSDRVKASLESIYSTIMDKEFFTDLNNSFADFLKLIKQVMDAAGGIKGVLAGIGLIVTTVFKEQMATSINNSLHNFKIFSGVATQEMNKVKKEAYDMAMSMTAGLKDDPSVSALRQSLTTTYDLQLKFNSAVKAMSPEQAAVAREAMKTAENYSQMAIELAEAVVHSEELLANQNKIANAKMGQKAAATITDKTDVAFGQGGSALLGTANSVIADAQGMASVEGMTDAIDRASAAVRAYRTAMREGAGEEVMNERSQALVATLIELENLANQSAGAFDAYTSGLQDAATSVVDISSRFDQFKNGIEGTETLTKKQVDEIRKIATEAKNAGMPLDKVSAALKKLGKAGKDPVKVAEAMKQLKSAVQDTVISTDMQNKAIANTAKNSSEAAGKIQGVNQVMLEGADAARNVALSQTNFENGVKRAGTAADEAKNKIDNLGLTYKSLGSFITGSLQGLSSFAMGLSSLSSLKDTLNNEDLSTYEKTLQVMISLGMAIPMLTTGLKSLANGYKFVTAASAEGLTASIARLAGIKLETVATQVVVTSKTGEVMARGAVTDAAVKEAIAKGGTTTATEIDTAATWANIGAKMIQYWYIGVIIIALAALAIALVAVANAYNEDANAAEAARKKMEEMQETYDETKKAAEDLKNTINDYNEAVDAMKGLEEGTLEYKQALLEANEEALKLLTTYKNLAQYAHRNEDGLIVIDQEGLDMILDQQYKTLSYQQMNLMKQSLDTSQKEEKSARTDFKRAHDLDVDDAKYDAILDGIASYMKKNNITDLIAEDLDKIDALDGLDDVKDAIADNISAYSSMGTWLGNTEEAQKNLAKGCADALWELEHGRGKDEEEKDRFTRRAEKSLFTTYQTEYEMDEAAQKAAKDKYVQEEYDKIIATYGSEGNDAPLADILAADMVSNIAMGGGIGSVRETAEAYAKAIGADPENLGWRMKGGFLGIGGTPEWTFYDSNGTQMDVKTAGDLEQAIADLQVAKENRIKAEIEAPNIVASSNQFRTDLIDNGLNVGNDFKNFMLSGQKVSGNDTATFELEDMGMTQEQAKYYQKNWDIIKDTFSGYYADDGFWKEQGFKSADEYITAMKEWIDNRADMSDGSAFGQEWLDDVKVFTTGIDADLESGDLTPENASMNKNYTAMKKEAEALADIYPELAEEARIFGEEALIGTQQWYEAFGQLKEMIDNLRMQKLVDDAKKIDAEIEKLFKEVDKNGTKEIEFTGNFEDLKKNLDKILEANYAIDVEIHAQAQEAFNTLKTANDNLIEQAGKIGANYRVAADDIVAVAAAFPGIMEGYQVLADGSIQLKSTVVKNATEAARAEVAASSKSVVEQIGKQVTLLKAKQTTYYAMRDAAYKVADGEITAAEGAAKIKKGLDDIEGYNNELLSTSKMTNAGAVADDSNAQAGTTASNWNEAYKSAANSAAKFAEVAKQAHKVAQTGEGSVSVSGFEVTYKGTSAAPAKETDTPDLKAIEDAGSDAAKWREIGDAYDAAGDALSGKISEMEGMMAAAEASGLDSLGQLDSIGDGNGPIDRDGKDKGGDKNKKQPKTEKPEYKDDSDKTKLEDELERYYHITNAIEDLNRELDSLSNAKDDAWGPNKIKAMDKEIAKLKQVRAATKQYAEEIKTNLAKDQSAAEGFGAVIGNDGIISNYESLMTQWVNELNAVKVDGYNAYEDQIVALKNQSNAIDSDADKDGSQKNALDEQIKALEDKRDKEIKAAEETFDARKKAIEQYEETRDLLADTNAELEEQLRQIQQLNYEKIVYKIEYKIEVNDRELKLLDKKLEALEKTIFKSVEAFSLIGDNMKTQLGIYLDDTGRNPFKIYSDGLDELNEKFELGKQGSEDGINEEQYIEGLGKIQDGLMENYDTLVAMDEKMQEYYSNAINDGLDLIHTYEEGFDSFLSTLDHYSSIMGLIGQEKNYDGMNSILEARVGVLNDRIESAKMTIADLEDQENLINAELAKDLPEESRKYWEEQLQLVTKAKRDEQDSLYGYLEEIGEAANQILKNNIDKAMKELRDSITGGVNLEYLMKDMERMSTYQEDYLTNTNKMYETNKIIAQAQLAIDKTQNAQAKQKYQEYVKYIEKLQTSEQLSKQELAIAQAKYEVLEAEIALEEARNAKSEVRLTRDSEGNFGYVYTANQEDMASATQEYLDKQNELYNISLEGSQQYREKYLQNIQNMLDEVEALEYAYLVDQTITKEEYEAQKLAIQEYYGEQGKSYAALFNAAQWELAASSYSNLMEENELFNSSQLSTNKEHQNAMAYNDAEYIGGLKTGMETLHTQLEEDLSTFNLNSYNETDTNYIKLLQRDQAYYTDLEKEVEQTQGYIYNQMTNPGAHSAAHHMNEFATTTGLAFDACETAATEWEQMIKPLNEAVGKSFSDDESNEGLAQKIDEVTDSSGKLKKKLVEELHPTVSDTWTKAHNMTAEWESHRLKIEEVKQSYLDLMTEIQNTITTMAQFDAASAPPPVEVEDVDPKYTTPPTNNTDTSTSSTNDSSSSTNGGNGVPEVGDLVTYIGGDYYYDSAGARPLGHRGPGKQVKITYLNPGAAYPIHVESTDSAYGWLKQDQISGYDTGGYTGDWGPEGKIALLHEKELVLNQQDTENFLTATSILREISQVLDNNALLASLGMINLTAATINTEADKILQQEVTIHADFPNVSDHTEIEMAIDNLINAASQYANRK